jgi:hypothetical protein
VFFVLNKHLRAQRRRLVVTVLLVALALSVTLAHSALGAGHMSMGGMDGHAAVAMCVAIGETAALAIVAIVLIAVGLYLRRLTLLLAFHVTALPRSAPRDLRARSSPVRLQVMRH